jgi:twitching motility protein PilU
VGEVKEMMEKSMSPGSQTFEQDLFRLVRQGKISTDEALANADSATNLGLLLGNSGIMPAMAGRAKQPVPGAGAGKAPGAPSFSDFKISEEPTEPRYG